MVAVLAGWVVDVILDRTSWVYAGTWSTIHLDPIPLAELFFDNQRDVFDPESEDDFGQSHGSDFLHDRRDLQYQ